MGGVTAPPKFGFHKRRATGSRRCKNTAQTGRAVLLLLRRSCRSSHEDCAPGTGDQFSRSVEALFATAETIHLLAEADNRVSYAIRYTERDRTCCSNPARPPRLFPRCSVAGCHIWFGGSRRHRGGTIAARGYFIPAKEFIMTADPKREQPDIPPQKPDIQPEPRPEEIPQDKDVPEKESPPMQL